MTKMGRLKKYPTRCKMSIIETLWHILGDTSPLRMLSNKAYNGITLTGDVLDLGSKIARFHSFKYVEPYHVTFSDISPRDKSVIFLDAEKRFPMLGNSFDCVTCLYMMEHIYDYHNVAAQTYRVLKHGGRFVGALPFMYVNHGSDDYFRYSWAAIDRILVAAGFKRISLVALGFGPFMAALSIPWGLMPRAVRLMLAVPCLLLDMLYRQLVGDNRSTYDLGYVYEYRKV